MFTLDAMLTFLIGAFVVGGGIGYLVGRWNSKYEEKYHDELFEN